MSVLAAEGFRAILGLGTAVVALLTGVDVSGDRSQTPWRPMGSYDPIQILKGRRNFEGAARKAYLCGEWLGTFLTNCTEYQATFYPRGTTLCGQGTVCGSFKATIAIKDWSLSGMEMESEAAVIEEITFDAYNVSIL